MIVFMITSFFWDKNDLMFMIIPFIADYSKWGLSVNVQKNKYMSVGSGIEEFQIMNLCMHTLKYVPSIYIYTYG